MDSFEELAILLNKAGVKLEELHLDDKELIKKLFLLSDIFQSCSSTNESSIMPFKNYLTIRLNELKEM